MALDEGDYTDATYWANEYERTAPIDREPLADMVLHVQRARLAIVDGKVELAEYHNQIAQATMKEDGHLKRYAFALGISLAIARLRGDVIVVAEKIEVALAIFSEARTCLTQDFFASEIALSLRALGRSSEAIKLLDEYVTLYRRETAPQTAILVSVIQLLKNESQPSRGEIQNSAQ
jgi:ATP/maltotriose-dependent transcriptional regulator MalT